MKDAGTIIVSIDPGEHDEDPMELGFTSERPLVVVLEDGETFSLLHNCTIRVVPDGIEGDDLDDAIKADEVPIAYRMTEWRK